MYIPKVLSYEEMTTLTGRLSPGLRSNRGENVVSSSSGGLLKQDGVHMMNVNLVAGNNPYKSQMTRTSPGNTKITLEANKLTFLTNSNSSKLSSLLDDLCQLQEQSERFSINFKNANSKLEHYCHSQTLNYTILNNKISQLKIDLKQREQDIKVLMDLIGTMDKASSIVDRSTDTQGSSQSSSSGNDNRSCRSGRSGRSDRSGKSGRSDKKKVSPSLKIFNKV